MKKNRTLYTIVVISAFLSSCYKDTSTLAEHLIEPVLVDTTGVKEDVFIGYQEVLSLSPKIKYSSPQSLSYEWTLSEKVKTEKKVEMKSIGDQLELNYPVERPIMNAPYLLRLTVTDKEHSNLQYFFTWNVYVQSVYITGLVIADTKDGITSNLTYVKNKDFSINYDKKEEVILRDILSADSVRINGLVSSLNYTCLGRFWRPHVSQLWITTTDGKVVRYNTSNFTVNGHSELSDLILYKPEGFKFNFLYKGGGSFFANTTHGNYSLPSETVNAFSTPDPIMGKAKFNNQIVATDAHSANHLNNLVWLEESTGAFTAHTRTGSLAFELATFNKTDIFDPNSLDGKIALAGEIFYNRKTVNFLLKDKVTGEYGIYQLDQGKANPYTIGSAKGLFKIPISFKNKMDAAVSYFFSKTENILYVITETAVYTITFGLGNEAVVNTTPIYTSTTNERIRKAKLFVQGQYAARTDEVEDKIVPLLPYNLNALILMSEKGENQGVVRVIPFINNGSNIDIGYTHVYDGLGKILDVISIGI